MAELTRREFQKALGISAFVASVLSPATLLRAEEAARGGTLRIVTSQEPIGLVELFQNTASAGTGTRVVEGLIHIDFDLNPQPYLATSWDISEDGLTYTFKLRDGVKFHDGKPFTSADVAFSILTVKQTHPRRQNTFANIVAVDTPDPLTAVIRLSKPAPYILGALTGNGAPIIPKHLYEGTDIATNPYNTAPVGTGPFIFKEWVHGSHYELVRNPDYWDQPKPYLDRIIVRFITDASARTAAFESDEIDEGGSSPVPIPDLERLLASGKFALEKRGAEQAGSLSQMFLNLQNKYLSDLRVRQAIAHAIDLNEVLKLAYNGYGVVSPSPLPPSMKQFHDPSIKPYTYDLALSEKLLDEAGFPRGGDGTRFKLGIIYNPGSLESRRAVDYVRSALAKVGINVEIKSVDYATYVRTVYTDGEFDLDIQTLVAGYDPTDGVARAYHSKNIKKGLPFSNHTHYINPEVDEIFDTAAVEPNEARRRELYVRLQNILYHDLPAINLIQFDNLIVYNKRVHNPINDAGGVAGNFADTYLTAS